MPIQSVSRALGILVQFGPNKPKLSLSEIATNLDLPKTTVHGLVRTLQKEGFLIQDDDSRKYSLGLKIFELGVVMAGHLDINQKSAPLAKSLADQTELTSRVGLWSGDSILVVLNALPRQADALAFQFGPRIPAYCSALGKAILANLPPAELDDYLASVELTPRTERTITDPEKLRMDLEETRRRGFSIGNREVVAVQAGLAAPIFRLGGLLVGAISLSGNPERILGAEQAGLAGRLLTTAETISRSLGFFPESQAVG